MKSTKKDTKNKGCFWKIMMAMFAFLLIVGFFILCTNAKLYLTQESTTAVVVGNTFKQDPDAGPIYIPTLQFKGKKGELINTYCKVCYQRLEPFELGKTMNIRYTKMNKTQDEYYIIVDSFWITWGVPISLILMSAFTLYALRNGDVEE